MNFPPNSQQLQREQALQLLGGFPLEGLLPEQRRLVGVYRAEYFRIGSSTEPADRPMAERAITALYAAAGHAAPAFEWGPSPRWGAELIQAQWSSVGRSLRDLLQDLMWDSLGCSLGSSLVDPLWGSLLNSLWVPLRASLWTSLRASLEASLEASLVESPGVSLLASLRGAQESYWMGHHVYCCRVLCVPYRDDNVRQLLCHDEVARSCGWWWPYQYRCICTDRPEVLEWNDETPPKLRRVRYRDGWEVCGSSTATVDPPDV